MLGNGDNEQEKEEILLRKQIFLFTDIYDIYPSQNLEFHYNT
jgi:hypothetical protein